MSKPKVESQQYFCRGGKKREEYNTPLLPVCPARPAGGRTGRHYSPQGAVHTTPIIFFVLVFTLISCWDKQDIDIIPAPVPVYTLNGFVTDIDTGDLLAGIPVKVSNYSTAHPDYDTTVYDTTDKNGYFEFLDVVSSGEVYLNAFKNEYQVYYKLLIMYWEDRQFDFSIPKLAIAEIYNIDIPEGNVGGITWKDGNTLAIVDTWEDLPIGLDSLNVFTKIWVSISGGLFERLSDDKILTNNRIYKALDFDGEHYIASSNPIWVVIAEDSVLLDGNFYYLHPEDQMIVNFLPLPIPSESVLDIAVNNDNIFLAAGHKLVRWNPAAGDTMIFFDSTAFYNGITYGDTTIFVYDFDMLSQNLVEMNLQFDRLNTYAILMKNDFTSRLNVEGYLTMDELGNLWMFGSNYGVTKIFKIELTQY